MFTRRTLFVLGAGSSFEADLPLGTELATIIRRKMDIQFEDNSEPSGSGDYELYRHVIQTASKNGEDGAKYLKAARRISAGLGFSQSIDDFLDQHRSDADVNHYGKVAIVRAVLEAERASKLYFDKYDDTTNFNPDRFADTWFAKFMYMLGRNVASEDVAQIFDNVSFIIFNYDRCVEHYLQNALQRLYTLSETDAISTVDKLCIVHPYGDVGSLREVPFGAASANYYAIAKGIKTYTEQIAATDMMQKLATEVSKAECIVFLGFAYHSQNMRLIQPAARIPLRPVYGTAFKMSQSDEEIVLQQLSNFFETNVHALDRRKMMKIDNMLKCSALFDYYAKSLSGD